mmetsp:Transcript_16476/g.24316  ORF Transcript_16476/g.24316 Transcript_16476/m.24316 type:complete len:130 (-) Transcript_16476:3031-3420(-)
MKRRRIKEEVERKVHSKSSVLLPWVVLCAAQHHVQGLVSTKQYIPRFGRTQRVVAPKMSFWTRFPTENRSRSLNCKSSTGLQMVLTTPDTIIEQASTQKLLDDLIDESVRTTSRKPIMMQFDPTGSSVS